MQLSKINNNSDADKLFGPTRKMASRFHTTSGTEIQQLQMIKQEIKLLTTAQIRGQEYSKLGRVKEDKMKNCRRMSQAIWMKY